MIASGGSDRTFNLVGREREQRVLLQRLDSACSGNGGLILVEGEAGIGKSTLVTDLRRSAAERGTRWLLGGCYDLIATPPLGPWREIFDHLAETINDDLALASIQLPELSDVPSEFVLHERIASFLRDLTATQPVVFVFEDLHWADGASLDLLRFAARVIERLPALLIATYRGEDLDRHHPLYTLIPLLVRETSTERIELKRLTVGDVSRLVETRYQLVEAAGEKLARYLHARTDGNALFVSELLRTFEEERLIDQDDKGVWRMSEIDGVPIPRLLKLVVDSRISRLGDEAAALLASGAVIAESVPLEMWKEVTGVDEDTLIMVSERAEAAHLVVAEARTGEVRFNHALVRDVFYESVPPFRRRRLHQHIGELLASRTVSDPDAVAYHFQQAGDPKAAEWLIKAGERAQAVFSWPTAVARYEAALSNEGDVVPLLDRGWLCYRIARLLRQIDRNRALDWAREARRIAETLDDRSLAAAALFAEGQLESVRSQTANGISAMGTAVAMIDALSPEEIATIDRQDKTSSTVILRGTYLMRIALLGRAAEVIAAFERSLPAPAKDPLSLRTTGDQPRQLGAQYSALGIAQALHGNVREAHDAFRQAINIVHALGTDVNLGPLLDMQLLLVHQPFETDHLDERHQLESEANDWWHRLAGASWNARIESSIAFADVLSGNWETVEDRLARVMEFPDWRRLAAAAGLGRIMHARGRSDEAWTLIERVLPNGAETPPGTANFFGAVQLVQLGGSLATGSKNLDVAREWLEANDRWFAWAGTAMILGRADGMLGWASYFRALGENEQSRHFADQALKLASAPRQPLALVSIHRFLGEFETDEGDPDRSRAHLSTALALALACQARYEQALTLLAIAELHARQQVEPLVPDALEQARGILTQLGASVALDRSEAIRPRRTRTRESVQPLPGGLTSREVDVLRLLAEGLSNSEIGDRLYLSRRTVEHHLSSIYSKLDVTTRSAATRFAVEHGII